MVGTMATIRAYTTVEQSKVLVGILSPESADHHYVRKVTDFRGNPVEGEWSYPKYGNPNSKYANYIVQNFTSYEKLPCWSLTALLSVLPDIHLKKYIFDGNTKYYATLIGIRQFNSNHYDNPIDACYEIILKLNELNLL